MDGHRKCGHFSKRNVFVDLFLLKSCFCIKHWRNGWAKGGDGVTSMTPGHFNMLLGFWRKWSLKFNSIRTKHFRLGAHAAQIVQSKQAIWEQSEFGRMWYVSRFVNTIWQEEINSRLFAIVWSTLITEAHICTCTPTHVNGVSYELSVEINYCQNYAYILTCWKHARQ